MKDEEMAEESFKRYRTTDEDYEDLNGGEKILVFNHEYGAEEQYHRLYKQGFLAGLKAGRPQWHDLRKDPNDLPKEEKIVLIFIEGGIKLIDCYDKYRVWHTYSKAKIIAWCEIPKFEEVAE